jgi:hypothetical protein
MRSDPPSPPATMASAFKIIRHGYAADKALAVRARVQK